ncbi:beta-eliminating lyase-related protein [Bradyrhizobium sp. DASA03076]|uniref:beta-eliminating lyase-related protein n=1 Tax=Bradyrhizobium sp. BLXBL-03 TaxID=3395916 RepID=UPI003F7249F8
MQSLYSDNVAGIHPRFLSAITEANEGSAASYAEDALTSELEDVVSALFDKPTKVFLTQTGTAANALSIAGLCRRYRDWC